MPDQMIFSWLKKMNSFIQQQTLSTLRLFLKRKEKKWHKAQIANPKTGVQKLN